MAFKRETSIETYDVLNYTESYRGDTSQADLKS